MPQYIPHTNSFERNEESFAEFFGRYYASFCFFANRYLKDSQTAEDIVGDVALKVWEKRGELRSEAALKSYFYTSLRNACLDWIAKEKRRNHQQGQYIDAVQTEQAPILENIIRTETLHQLEVAIENLPPQCRKVFIKLFKEGKTLSEAAEEMGLSIFTIKAQRQRGIQLLRKRLMPSSLLLLVLMVGF